MDGRTFNGNGRVWNTCHRWVKPETGEGWEKLLRDSGLGDIVVRPYKPKKLEKAINEVKLSGTRNIANMDIQYKVGATGWKSHARKR